MWIIISSVFNTIFVLFCSIQIISLEYFSFFAQHLYLLFYYIIVVFAIFVFFENFLFGSLSLILSFSITLCSDLTMCEKFNFPLFRPEPLKIVLSTVNSIVDSNIGMNVDKITKQKLLWFEWIFSFYFCFHCN